MKIDDKIDLALNILSEIADSALQIEVNMGKAIDILYDVQGMSSGDLKKLDRLQTVSANLSVRLNNIISKY